MRARDSRDAAHPSSTRASRTLVLFDADVPSALAAAYAAEQAALGPSAPVGALVGSGISARAMPGRERPAPRDEAPAVPLLLPAYAGMPEARERAAALARTLDILGAQRAEGDPPDVTTRPELDGPGQTRLLVHAALLALETGCDTVIWPIQLGEDLRGADPSVDRVARAIDRAMLIARLAGLDADLATGIDIQTPFVDLSERQIAELVMDIEAPLAACWWWGGTSPAALAAHDRWGTILRSLGWGGALGPA